VFLLVCNITSFSASPYFQYLLPAFSCYIFTGFDARVFGPHSSIFYSISCLSQFSVYFYSLLTSLLIWKTIISHERCTQSVAIVIVFLQKDPRSYIGFAGDEEVLFEAIYLRQLNKV
jgi:hypothetical protein